MAKPSGGEPVSPLIFLHLPKAAGVTLHTQIRRQYARRRIFTIAGNNVGRSLSQLHAMPTSRRHALQVVKGHMPFGLHELLAEGATYITMVRDPVARSVSAYRYALAQRGHWLHKHAAKAADAQEFMESQGGATIADQQVRHLAGALPSGPLSDREANDPELLRIAIENMEHHFAAVGLQERFEESLVLFARRLGWTLRPFMRWNETPGASVVVDQDLVDAIERSSPMDVALYEWASQRFDHELQAEGASLQAEVDSFQARLERHARHLRPVSKVLTRLEPIGRRIPGARAWFMG